MRIKDLGVATHLSNQLTELREKRELLSNATGVAVSIQSHYQDDVMVRAALPGMIAEVDRRIRDNILQLKNLGVEL